MQGSAAAPFLLVSLLFAACDHPPDAAGPLPMFPTQDAGPGQNADSGEPGLGAGAGGNPPVVKGPAFATVTSDFVSSTTIGLLDDEGNVLDDDYLNSGSRPAGLSAALSSDVELPRHSGDPGSLVIIDRFLVDVVTRVRLSDGAVLGQVKTHTPPDQGSTSSYSSNPQDYIQLDSQTAWVTRFEPNPTAPLGSPDRGSDLLGINPSTMQRTGERIDLGVLASTVDGKPMYARPSRMVRVGNTVVVGTLHASDDFAVSGPGVVGLVDMTTRTVTPVPLGDLQSCSEVDSVPGDPGMVLVVCGGAYKDGRRATAGIVLLRVNGSQATIEHVWRAKDDASEVPFTSSVVSLGGTRVGAASNVLSYYGEAGDDVYVVLDVATGSKTEIFRRTPGRGTLGTSAFSPGTGVLLLPDASVDANMRPTAGVRRFKRAADGTFSELPMVKVAPRSAQPVRHVYPL
jgi:hypothetical protein